MKTLCAIAALLMFHGWACAELRWEKRQLEFHPAPADTTVTAEFAFTNAGSEPVTIESVQSSCGCMTAQTAVKAYATGETGRVTAIFDIGQRTGVQTKTIAVKLAGEAQPTTLTMVVHIPELLTLAPQLLFWQSGEAPEARTIQLTPLPEAGLRIARIVTPDPRFAARLETIESGKSYKLVVTPTQTTAPAMAVVSIECIVGADTRKYFQAYAQVRSADPPGPPPRP